MAALFNMILMCFAMLNVVFAMPAAQPGGVDTKENMKTAETSYWPYSSYGFGGYPQYSSLGYRSGLGMSIGYPTSYSHSIRYLNDYPQYLSLHIY